MEDINLAVVISCNCPFIEGIQSWQNQFPTGSDVIFTVSVSHSESILASLPGSFHLIKEPRGGVTVLCTAIK